jgi:hypothetical protein
VLTFILRVYTRIIFGLSFLLKLNRLIIEDEKEVETNAR